MKISRRNFLGLFGRAVPAATIAALVPSIVEEKKEEKIEPVKKSKLEYISKGKSIPLTSGSTWERNVIDPDRVMYSASGMLPVGAITPYGIMWGDCLIVRGVAKVPVRSKNVCHS